MNGLRFNYVHFFVLIFIACTFGCKQELRSTRAPAATLGQPLSAPGLIQNEQQIIAYDICLAYRYKNTLFRSEMNGRQFSFALEHTNCLMQKTRTSLDALLEVPTETTQPLSWKVNSHAFFKLEQTHEHGFLAKLCPEVLKGGSSYDSYEATNGQLFKLHFFNIQTGVQGVLVKTAVKGGDGQYIITKTDELEVVTGQNLVNLTPGIVKKHTQTVPCPDNRSESFTQEFQHIYTP